MSEALPGCWRLRPLPADRCLRPLLGPLPALPDVACAIAVATALPAVAGRVAGVASAAGPLLAPLPDRCRPLPAVTWPALPAVACVTSAADALPAVARTVAAPLPDVAWPLPDRCLAIARDRCRHCRPLLGVAGVAGAWTHCWRPLPAVAGPLPDRCLGVARTVAAADCRRHCSPAPLLPDRLPAVARPLPGRYLRSSAAAPCCRTVRSAAAICAPA